MHPSGEYWQCCYGRRQPARPGHTPAGSGSLARVIAAMEGEHAALEQAIADHLAQHTALVQVREQLLNVLGR